MQLSLPLCIEILENTPQVLQKMLGSLSEEWIMQNEGEGTWSPFDIVGHLLHGEKTDWMARVNIILDERENKTFTPFDRFAQLETSKGKTLQELLDAFAVARSNNLNALQALNITEDQLQLKGIHPTFGEVTLSQLIATWVVHDLDHIAQIARVMAKQYQTEVGPWKEFLKIVQQS